MIPFTIAAILTLIFAPMQNGAYIFNDKFNTFIDEHDYYAHLTYQKSFSIRQMGSFNSASVDDSDGVFDKASSGGFPVFFFDTDGLPSVRITETNNSVNIKNIIPIFMDKTLSF